jgi:hypothetical protein
VLLGVAVHDDAVVELDRPGALARPPSWWIPSSKLVRVRSEGLKKTRAIDLPARVCPCGPALKRRASASKASISARL